MFKQLLALINRKKSKVDFENSVIQYLSTIQELQEENKKLRLVNQMYIKKIKKKNKRIRELESSINTQNVQLNLNQEQNKAEQRNTASTVINEKVSSFSEKKKVHKPLNEKFEENSKHQGLKSDNKTIRKLAFVTKLPLNHPLLMDTSKQLLKESIQLAVYSEPFLQSQSRY
ncbi:hypothetical protein V7075_28730, partial [Neobacillus drentensis]|uniref:hypothetical protein n=1 Tax=Neobacillus drentensis TaxID=220684 RepID=UPI002FFE3709